MKIEEQVVSLELSKQLKEAGYKQEGVWWWCDTTNKNYLKVFGNKEGGHDIPKPFIDRAKRASCWSTNKYDNIKIGKAYFVAPTVAELGRALPDCFPIQSASEYSDQRILYHKDNGLWHCSLHKENKFIMELFFDSTEANARAKMWLYLKQNNLL